MSNTGSTEPGRETTGPGSPPGSAPPPPPPAGAPSYSAPPPSSGIGGAASALSAKLPPIDAEALSKTPWVVGAAAILIGALAWWAGAIISALQHYPGGGLDIRDRLLRLLAPGNLDWAVAILLAVALLVLGSSASSERPPMVTFLFQVLLIAAGAIAAFAVVNAIIELTTIGTSIDVALTGVLQYLAAVPIAGAAGLWCWRASPSALPGHKPTTT